MRLTYRVRLLPHRPKDGRNRRMRIYPPTRALPGLSLPTKPYDRTTGVEDEAEAQAVADAEQVKLNQQLDRMVDGHATGGEIPTAGQLVEAYLAWQLSRSAEAVKDGTLAHYRNSVTRILQTRLAELPATEVDSSRHRDDFVDDLKKVRAWGRKGAKLSAGTVHTTMVVWTQAWVWAQQRQPQLALRPWKNPRRKGKKVRTIKRPFTPAELNKLLDFVARDFPQHYDLVLLLADTGMRISEATGLRWRDVDLDVGTATAYFTKTDSQRRVMLPARVVARLAARKASRINQWVFPRKTDPARHQSCAALTVMMRRARERIGIVKGQLDVHSLRRSWIRRAVDSGVPMAVIQQQVGHKEFGTTLDYSGGVADSVLQDAVATVAATLDTVPTPPGGESMGKDRKPCSHRALVTSTTTMRGTSQGEWGQGDSQDGPQSRIGGDRHGSATLHELTHVLARVVELAAGDPKLWAVVQDTIKQHAPQAARRRRRA